MNLKNILLLFLTLYSSFLFSQQKFTLSGIISESKTNETVIGANLQIEGTSITSSTNEYGFFSITLPEGTYTLVVSSFGFKTERQKLELKGDVKLNFRLEEENKQLKEIVITDTKQKANIRKPEMSVHKLNIQTIKQIPAVLGEVDIIKSLLSLPGVTNAGEGQSGFNVRGGGADQNLVLLDEATVYNASHVFGFFSVFNPDAIKDLKLYKGGIPAKYGGRASSVLDIYQKDGNSNRFSANGGIGLITSRFLAEGPIVKERGSFLVGGRSSYAHLFLKLSDNKNAAYFYDLNAKLNYKLNNNNNLYLSSYFGRDVFEFSNTFYNTYGNTTLNLRWNHLYSDKLFSNLSLIYSDYYYGLRLDFVGFNWNSGIKNYNIKYDFKHYIVDKLKLNYGLNAIYSDFNPGIIEPTDQKSPITYKKLDQKYAFEPALYLDVEQKIGSKIGISYGLRYSQFYRLGNSTINYYDNDNPVIFDSESKIYGKATPIGQKTFGSFQKIAFHDYLEPRFAMAYELTPEQSLKLSYNRMVQYLQLVSNTTSPTPLDVWTPSDNYIKPQVADQVAMGYFNNFKNDIYTLEVETFYKKIQNRMDYIDGADLIANEAIEQVVLNGQMRSYGLELLLRKNSGNLTGWLSYTLSRSEQQTPGRNNQETGINDGNWYRSAYDKPHNIVFTGAYKLNEKWSFGANFTLQSGQPVTYPNAQYVYQDLVVPSYGLRNENRLPTYHRLDVSATLKPRKNVNRKWQAEWVFSIYNLYNRKNAASISFRQNKDTGINEAVRLSIFGMIPSVSYNFKF
ncbi:TonB-dependent receptor [Flavobacterium columnare]|uniref:isocitrate dehydrogenase (NADP(+)) n=1 Tax=Flavobacterium columnare TaxID=996 RepID=A0AAI8CFY5_9FLAO|nr:TonB-dependent receptor [Flavobacterium columnare]AMO19062.1 TonB-dependent receptor [Flavobacterium columnare]AUX16988.1 collagen-binding protein [Flavobacterium columnare]MEB3800777.1 TonB-dependent receptor [Flavobacterium columnare]QOG55997.1 TonB-dependent receptor [Flavobacterium columnare]QOG58719.1 TonB-dependent receptor [Flavobacterium columnare]